MKTDRRKLERAEEALKRFLQAAHRISARVTQLHLRHGRARDHADRSQRCRQAVSITNFDATSKYFRAARRVRELP